MKIRIYILFVVGSHHAARCRMAKALSKYIYIYIYILGGGVVQHVLLSTGHTIMFKETLSPQPPTPPRTLRPFLTGCTTYRIYLINWCIISTTVRFIPLNDL